jgi:YfiH family protein
MIARVTVPAVDDPFYWSAASWGAALRCRALDPIAPHLFTTRQLELSSENDWRVVAEAVGATAAAGLTQVHGNAVVTVGRDWTPAGARPEADALVSNNPAVALTVRAADCVPLLMGDRRTGAVAAVHAGWRGTAAGVAPAALRAMEREFGTRPADIVAAIGPSIGPCCYEVGTELVDAFAAAGHPRHLIDRWFLARPPADGTRRRRPGAAGPTLRLDVAAANRDQLILAGVEDANIHTAMLCTAMHLEVLTSFRAEKERAGRLAGVIRALHVG